MAVRVANRGTSLVVLGQSFWQPEHDLLFAMLALAAQDCHLPRLRPRDKDGCRQEARDWVAAKALVPYGFGWVCEHLGLDPDATAERVLTGRMVPSGFRGHTLHYAGGRRGSTRLGRPAWTDLTGSVYGGVHWTGREKERK